MTDIAVLLKEDCPDLVAIFERLYPELKKIANSRLASLGAGRTLTPTALVHEAYLKLLRSENLNLQGRRYFFACAGRVMRDIVVDYLRESAASKRGGDRVQITFSEDLPTAETVKDLLDLEEALGELEQIDPGQRELVEMKFFAGLTEREISELTQTPYRTIQRRWARARAYLHMRLREIAPD